MFNIGEKVNIKKEDDSIINGIIIDYYPLSKRYLVKFDNDLYRMILEDFITRNE